MNKLHAVYASASALAILVATSGQAGAQTTAAPPQSQPAPAAKADAAAAGEVIITGSKVRRQDVDTVGELVTVTHADIKQSQVGSVGEFLQKLPSVGVSYNSNGTQGTSFGGSSVSLRYLANSDGDADRTLVLVDGHRWVDGVGARGIRDFVDLNTIPLGMINTMEVLQDGASALYGADAIAGVVDLKTPTNFQGLTTDLKYGVSSRGDGAEYKAVVNFGQKFDRGSVFLSGTYVKDNPVTTEDRSLTQVSLAAGPNNLSTAPSSPFGLYVLPGYSTAAHPITQNAGVTVATGLASYHTAALPGDYYNADAQGVDAVGPSERYGLYGKFTYSLPADIQFTADALFNRRISSQVYSPTNLSIGGTGGTYKGFAIAANQAFNPFGVGFAANQPWSIAIYTPLDGGRNQYEQDDTSRVSASLAGDLNLFSHPWDWTLFGSAAENHMQFTAVGGIDLEHLSFGLSSPSVCAAQPGCTPINIFGQMTPAQAAYINSVAHETNLTRLYDLTFDVNGTLIDLPAGPLKVALGFETRENEAQDNPDRYANTVSTGSGVLPLPATTPTTTQVTRTPTSDGSYNVREAYVEVVVPILADVPLVKKLEADLASRYSDYSSSAGSKVTSKVGIGYRPVDGVLFRGTWSQGFRAPSLIELYTGARQTNLAGSNTDPCDGGAAAHPTYAGCAGIPSTYNQVSYNGGLLPETISGNPALKPETAVTWSYGMTLSPTWASGLAFTLDYYKITITNAISTPSVTTALDLCAVQGGAYCSALMRDPSSGQVLNFLSSYENLNQIETDGVDTSIRYHFASPIGAWDAMLSGTYLHRFQITEPNPGGGAPILIEAAGTSTGGTFPATARSTYPHWKSQASLRWSDGDWALMWRGRYIGSTTDGAPPALPTTPVKGSTVAAITYHDLQAEYHIARFATDVTIGVNNLFDQMPPASYANAPINFDIYTYDVMGRYVFVAVSKKF